MKIFLDANVLVTILNKEYPLFTYASRIISLADNKKYTVHTTPICLAIAFYFSEKKSGAVMAKKKVRLLTDHLSINKVDAQEVTASLENNMVTDFEDGLEYYAALHNKCDVIVTEDKEDFYFSKIEILGCKSFLEKYLL